MDEPMAFEAPPQTVFSILQERARGDKELALHIEAATWQAAALTLKQAEGQADEGGDDGNDGNV